MKINLHNYEALLLDHIEGRLSKQQSALLKAFVNSHPELGSWEQLTAELPQLTAPQLSFPAKDQLFQPGEADQPTYSPSDETMIKAVEGMASESEQAQLQQWLQNSPELRQTYRLFGLTKLKPDTNIVFPHKQKLRKTALLATRPGFARWSAAAAIALLAGWGWWFMANDVPPAAPNAQVMVANTQVETPKNELPPKNIEQEKPLPKNRASQVPKNQKAQPATKKTTTREKLQALPPMRNSNTVIQLNLARLQAPAMLMFEPSLHDQLNLVAILEQMPEFAPNTVPSAPRRVAGNLMNRAIAALKPMKSGLSENTALWNLAQSGVNTYNFLTDKDVQLVKTTHSSGQGTVVLDADRVSFERKFGKKTE